MDANTGPGPGGNRQIGNLSGDRYQTSDRISENRSVGRGAPGGGVPADRAVGDRPAGETRRSPWGFWPTIGFTVAIMFVIGVAQLLGGMIFILRSDLEMDPANFEWLFSHGSLVSIVTIVSAPVAIGFTVFFVKIRKGPSVRDYLGLRLPKGEEFLKWVLITVAVAVIFDGLAFLAGEPLVSDFGKHAYLSVGSLPLLWIALVVMASLQEEVVFRGFMFEGILRSRLGLVGAIGLSSAGWAILHVQYNWIQIATIFISGIIIGLARYRTRSLYVCIAMHSVWSLIAVAQVELYYRWLLS
jgi:membrane protease YdiL (CAAX protease family)